MYVKGVSTRKVSQITEQLCGTEISATQVSRIAKMLDEELEQFRERELQEYRVVYLDAHYEKVSVNGTVQDLAILKALGVNRWGKREVLGVSATLSEAEVHWRKFCKLSRNEVSRESNWWSVMITWDCGQPAGRCSLRFPGSGASST